MKEIDKVELNVIKEKIKTLNDLSPAHQQILQLLDLDVCRLNKISVKLKDTEELRKEISKLLLENMLLKKENQRLTHNMDLITGVPPGLGVGE